MKPSYHTDKQLRAIDLELVLEKRKLDQALNAKEFALLAGISYSTAREWFHSPGFPVFRGVVFWQDFVSWRIGRLKSPQERSCRAENSKTVISSLPPRCEEILRQA